VRVPRAEIETEGRPDAVRAALGALRTPDVSVDDGVS